MGYWCPLTGSAAFTMCAKETAIWEKETHADTCPMVWNRATGSRAMRKPWSILGTGCSLKTHRKTINRPDAAAGCVNKGCHHFGVRSQSTLRLPCPFQGCTRWHARSMCRLHVCKGTPSKAFHKTGTIPTQLQCGDEPWAREGVERGLVQDIENNVKSIPALSRMVGNM